MWICPDANTNLNFSSFVMLSFRKSALLSTITFVAVLLYNSVRCNRFGNAFKSNMECCGEISCFRNNAGTGLQGKVILFKCL